MSKPDKPIFNQQGGRGKLYGPTHGATYMGTYQMPDGKPAYTEPFKKDEAKGADMATTADAKLDKIYVVMVVGGVAVAWCESFDKAVAVCDALTLGAKASGFAATYDVVEVKKWTA